MSSMLFEEYWSELSSANNLHIGSILTATLFCDNDKSASGHNTIHRVYQQIFRFTWRKICVHNFLGPLTKVTRKQILHRFVAWIKGRYAKRCQMLLRDHKNHTWFIFVNTSNNAAISIQLLENCWMSW